MLFPLPLFCWPIEIINPQIKKKNKQKVDVRVHTLRDRGSMIYSSYPLNASEYLLTFNITFPFQFHDIHYLHRTSWEKRDAGERKLLQEPTIRKKQPFRFRLPPSTSREFQPPLIPDPDLTPAPTPPTPTPTPAPAPAPTPAPSVPQSPQPAPSPSPSPPSSFSAPSADNNSRTILPEAESRSRPAKRSTKNHTLVLVAAIGGSLLLLLVVIGVAVYRYGKVATVKPWATGLSGQLQRAFVTGTSSYLYTANHFFNLCVINFKV